MALSDKVELFGLEVFELADIKREYPHYFKELFPKAEEKFKKLMKVRQTSLNEA